VSRAQNQSSSLTIRPVAPYVQGERETKENPKNRLKIKMLD